MRGIKFRRALKGGGFHYWGFIEPGVFTSPSVSKTVVGGDEEFIGEYDKNGVEIYEEDIVSPVEPLQGGVNGMAIVKYEDGGFSPFAVPGWEVVARPKTVTVIGNIHENQELLK